MRRSLPHETKLAAIIFLIGTAMYLWSQADKMWEAIW
jgi:hypothetical protein